MSTLENGSSNGIKVSEARQEELVESLKEQEQWVAFTEDKTPINPETGSAAKANDSETWSDYETACAYAESNDLLVGFALTGENLVFVDLDGCRDPETGDIEDWALDILNRIDSYTEVSTSGTGLHVLVHVDVDIHSHKEKMDNQVVDVSKTSEIEVYDDNRFVLFTFDHVAGFPTNVASCDGFEEVYTSHFGEAPEQSETPDFSGVEFSLSEEEILEKTLESDEKFSRLWDGDTTGYGSQSEADMALVSKLAFWTACDRDMMDSLFRQSDLMRNKWDEQRGDETYGEMTIRKAVESTHEVYEGPAGGIPENIDLVQKGGQYGRYRKTEDGPVFEPVTNFTLERKEVLTEEGEQFVRLEVRPANAEPFEVTVSPEVFNEPRSFKTNICTRLSTSFSGSSHDLPSLREIVLRQNSPERVSTTQIGLHENEFVTPNATFRTDSEAYTHSYRETGSALAQKWDVDDLEYDEEEVCEILELLPQIRKSERWLPVLGYYYAALFAPKIREFEGELPLCTVTGETGSGKSSSLMVLNQAVGLDGTAFSADSTKFSIIEHLSSTNCVPVWYDEYKPSEIQNYRLDTFHSFIRSATNGRTETRGDQDFSNLMWRLVAPVVISGEQRIQGSAEQRRAIMTQFKRSTTDRGTSTYEAFDELQQYDLENHAKFAIEQLLSLISDEDLEAIWEQSKEHVRDIAEDDVGGLAINALAMVKLGMTVYMLFCDRAEAIPAVEQCDVDDAIRYVAAQKGVENRTTHVDELLEQVVRCIDSGKLTAWGSGYGNPSYKFTNIGEDDEELRLKMNRVYPEVSKYLKDYNIDIDLLAKDDYMDRFADMAEDDDSYVLDNSKQTRGLNRCVAVDSYQLEEKLDVDLEDVRLELRSER